MVLVLVLVRGGGGPGALNRVTGDFGWSCLDAAQQHQEDVTPSTTTG